MRFYIFSNNIADISVRWGGGGGGGGGDNERRYEMEPRLQLKRPRVQRVSNPGPLR